MKKIFFLALLSIVGMFVFATKPDNNKFSVDAKSSTVKWKGFKVSESHEGIVNIKEGTLFVKDNLLVGGQVIIDMSSIINTDIESAKYKTMLEDHLKSNDFFDVKKYPTAVLTIRNATKVKGNSYQITADLTIKGITHSIKFDAEVTIKNGQVNANSKIKIDRTKWDIRYNSGNFFTDLGDKLILDELELDVMLMTKGSSH